MLDAKLGTVYGRTSMDFDDCWHCTLADPVTAVSELATAASELRVFGSGVRNLHCTIDSDISDAERSEEGREEDLNHWQKTSDSDRRRILSLLMPQLDHLSWQLCGSCTASDADEIFQRISLCPLLQSLEVEQFRLPPDGLARLSNLSKLSCVVLDLTVDDDGGNISGIFGQLQSLNTLEITLQEEAFSLALSHTSSKGQTQSLKVLRCYGAPSWLGSFHRHENEAGWGCMAGLEELSCALDPQGLHQVCRGLTKLQALDVITADVPLPGTLSNLCHLTRLHCDLDEEGASPLCSPEIIPLLTNLRSLRCGLDDEGLRQACFFLTKLESLGVYMKEHHLGCAPCISALSRLSELLLQGNNLSYPDSISCLTQLRSLILEGEDFSKFPTGLSCLVQLTYLSACAEKLGIDQSLLALTALKCLSLSRRMYADGGEPMPVDLRALGNLSALRQLESIELYGCSIMLARTALEWYRHPTLQRVFLRSSCAQDSETMAYCVALTVTCADGQAAKLKILLNDRFISISDWPDDPNPGARQKLYAPETFREDPSTRLCAFELAIRGFYLEE